MTTLFIEPCDVLYFRDDLPFGAALTQVGRCQFPPRPSVMAGALRSKVLASHLDDLSAFASGHDVPEVVAREIGYVENDVLRPGSFQVRALHLGYRDPAGHQTSYFRAGRDLVAPGKGVAGHSGLAVLRPATTNPIPGVSSLGRLAPVGVVPGMEPVSGWIEAVTYGRYLAGEAPDRSVTPEAEFVAWDYRTGIGLDAGSRTVDQGRLFSSQGALLKSGWGFVVEVEGCSLLPQEGLLRLGGDGRMARLAAWTGDEPDWSPIRRAISASGRFRWVLQTPGIFARGWLPRGMREDGEHGWVYELEGFRARMVSVAIGAPELAGGWDLARRRPKPFRRMAPAGSVYWFEIERGSGEDAWRLFQRQSVSDEQAGEGFGLVHLGGW
jgi:CRISPR-associated protein Cmr3